MDPSHPSEPDPANADGGPPDARPEDDPAETDELAVDRPARGPGGGQPGVIGLLAVLLPLVLVVGVGVVLVVVTMGASEDPATAGGVLQPTRAASAGAKSVEAYHPIGPVRLLSPMPGGRWSPSAPSC